MGVHGLWQLVSPVGRPIALESLENKILAVDVSIWLNQAIKGFRSAEGQPLRNAHLLGLFHRVCKLLFYKIKPVFVFDGGCPQLKKQTLAARHAAKELALRNSKAIAQRVLANVLTREAVKEKQRKKGASSQHASSDEGGWSQPSESGDDLFRLPPIPSVQDDSNEGEEDYLIDEWEAGRSHHALTEAKFQNLEKIDIQSEDFKSLPAEIRHEILTAMKSRRRRWAEIGDMPKESHNFSSYQLGRLLHRRQLQQEIEEVAKEMNSQTSGKIISELWEQDSIADAETGRIVSEDFSHFLLVKRGSQRESSSDKERSCTPEASEECQILSDNAIVSNSGQNQKHTDMDDVLLLPDDEIDEITPFLGWEDRAITAEHCVDSGRHDISTDDSHRGSTQSSVLPHPQNVLEDDIVCINNESAEKGTISQLPGKCSSDVGETMLNVESVSEPVRKLQVEVPLKTKDESEGITITVQPLCKTLQAEGFEKLSSRTEEPSEPVSLTEGLALVHDTQSLCDPAGSTSRVSEEPLGKETSPITDKKIQVESISSGLLNFDVTTTKGHMTATDSLVIDSKEMNMNAQKIKQDVISGNSTKSVVECPQKDEHTTEVIIDLTKQEDDDIFPLEVFLERNVETSSEHSEGTRMETMSKENFTKVKPLNQKNLIELPSSDEDLEAIEKELRTEERKLRLEQGQHERQAATVTDNMYRESQDLLKLFGIPYVASPMEAEAQCAQLDRLGLTHGTITDDSDIWLFGGKVVYKNFFHQGKYVENFKHSDIESQFGLDQIKLICFAMLTGSDYTEGVEGVGGITAVEILSEFPGQGIECLQNFRTWWDSTQQQARPPGNAIRAKFQRLELKPGFPSQAVFNAYMTPEVDTSAETFSWGIPDLDLLREFTATKFGWTRSKTDEILLPVIKKANERQTQMRLDSYFTIQLQREKNLFPSKRLQKALNKMNAPEPAAEDAVDTPTGKKAAKRGRQSRKRPSGIDCQAAEILGTSEESSVSSQNDPKRQAKSRGKKGHAVRARPKTCRATKTSTSATRAALDLSENSSDDS